MIQSVEIVRVAMPLISPFRTAYGDDHEIESVLVRLGDGEYFGWGEGTPLAFPSYSPESARTLFVVARDFIAPLLLGKEIESGKALQEMLVSIKGNFFAKGAFDLAWWDLQARRTQQPLWKLLGGQSPTIQTGADFGVMDSYDLLLQAIAGAVEQGYKRVKLKFRRGWDVEMLSEVRAAFPDMVFHIDCNGSYSLSDLPMFQSLNRFNLAMIEQPLAYDDLIDHAKLQSQITTPICLDESITSLDKVRKAIEIGAGRWVNLKPGRVGGITKALAIHDYCQSQNVPCWIGGMLESAIGASHCLALATLSNIAYPCDIFPTSRFYRQDLTKLPMVHSGPGQFEASPEPGIGVQPDNEHLQQCALEQVVLKA